MVVVQHILIDGALEPHARALSPLVKLLNLEESEDLFRSSAVAIEDAYDRQARRIAYDRRAHRSGTVVAEVSRESEVK